MANLPWKGMTVKIDNASGSLTDITNWTNQASIAAVQEALEDTALVDEERSYLSGLAGATVSLNGFINSTTDGIFGPLVGNRTTATKTFQLYNTLKYYNGETWATDVEVTGEAGQLQTWSVNLTFDGAVNRTSVTLS